MEKVKIGVLALQEAKNLVNQMAKQAVEVFLDHNEATCTRGCAVTVEVLAWEKDLPAIKAVLDRNFSQLAQGHEFDPEVAGSVYDTSKENAICPACGFEFATSNTECPDCGLVLG